MAEQLNTLTDTDASTINDIRVALDAVNFSADRVSRTMTRTFATAITSGKSFETVLQSLALSLSRVALNAALRPLQQGLSSALGSAVSSLTASGSGAPAIAPFAEGGIVSRPVFFGSGGGLGLMGEKGAEAIIPLSRGPDGRLGLAADRAQSRPVNVTVNISTPDVAAFQRSQVQVAGALARAVGRGRRGV
ncbi:MAG: phage tail tape measure protein [Hyphomicrobiales bacterium]|nr:phage tail tape measure protein [Hyphomicrobiales bacterium]